MDNEQEVKILIQKLEFVRENGSAVNDFLLFLHPFTIGPVVQWIE